MLSLVVLTHVTVDTRGESPPSFCNGLATIYIAVGAKEKVSKSPPSYMV